jgi:SAM-dependent methyltransferase
MSEEIVFASSTLTTSKAHWYRAPRATNKKHIEKMLINPHSILPQFFVILGCFSQTSAPLSKSIHHKPDINITSHLIYIKVIQKEKGRKKQTIHWKRNIATMPPPPPQESGPLNLLRPLLLLSYSAFYIPHTLFNLVATANLKPLTNFSSFKDHWFARFWTWFGPRSREAAAAKVTPLIQNNARGVLLDIGPGSGQWLFLFARALNPSITKIYGVEPNVGLHAELRANAVKAGLGDVYEVIGCGAEELGTKGGVQQGSVDTIVTVQCLCSIPGPERVIRDLYPLLKPGGKWLVYEHVRTKFQKDFVGFWQREFPGRVCYWFLVVDLLTHFCCRCGQCPLATFLQWMRPLQAD